MLNNYQNLPVLGNVKRPFELQVSCIIIVNEFGNGIVMATGHHARRSLFGVDWSG